MTTIKLVQTVRDTITGFVGVVTGRAEYLTGCTQCVIVPTLGTDGNFRESCWFDEQRLVVLDAPIITLDNSETPGCDAPRPARRN